MPKKYLAILAIPVLILALSCKPTAEPTATDTASTDASATTATDTGATASTQTFAPPPPAHEIDHYKFWKVKSVPLVKPVTLQGQFDKERWQANVTSIEYLGNPVEKNGEPIQKPEWHLVAYRLKAAPQPARSVIIENQFRRGETLHIKDPAWLLLPASKAITGGVADPPKGADHYVCYTVSPADPVPGPVKLFDQFDRMREKREVADKLWASFFCVPVSKNGGTINKPKEHLTIYRIEPPDPYAVVAVTKDQFGQRKLAVERSELLAVPSFKEWHPPQ